LKNYNHERSHFSELVSAAGPDGENRARESCNALLSMMHTRTGGQVQADQQANGATTEQGSSQGNPSAEKGVAEAWKEFLTALENKTKCAEFGRYLGSRACGLFKRRTNSLTWWRHPSEEADLRVSLWRLSVTVFILGYLLDASKPVLWKEWAPLKQFGGYLFIFYLATNLIGSLIAWACASMMRDWYAVYFSYAMILFLVGPADAAFELGLMPVVWHGGLGFAAAATLGFRKAFRDLGHLWPKVEAESDKDRLEVRKELMKEMQWAFTTYVQIWVALTAVFGVSMTILFRSGNINERDLKATGIQMALGFGSCLCIAYWWGLSHAMKVMQKVRSEWLAVGNG
jgi:hypothetical protein